MNNNEVQINRNDIDNDAVNPNNNLSLRSKQILSFSKDFFPSLIVVKFIF